MCQHGEVDRELVPYLWHWHFFPIIDLFGPELVWAIGLEALGYPPTWAGNNDTKEDDLKEFAAVESALIQYSQRKFA